MLPTAGLRLQLTAEFGLFVKVGTKVWLCDGFSMTVFGLSEITVEGVREMVAVAVFVGSASLVAVTVTVWAEEMLLGVV
jgi:hypothetical protein